MWAVLRAMVGAQSCPPAPIEGIAKDGRPQCNITDWPVRKVQEVAENWKDQAEKAGEDLQYES